MEKTANTKYKINELIANRWSPHVLDSDKPVSKLHILTMLEAASWAPSSHNVQPYRILVCDKYSNLNSHQKVVKSLDDINDKWAWCAPLYFVFFVKKDYTSDGELNLIPFYDTGAAAEHLCLQAIELGIYTRQMEGFYKDVIRQEFNVPEDWMPISIIATGYLGDYDKMDKIFSDKDNKPRTRKPLSEIAYEGTWGNPISTL
ncbi:MAG TPA: nitroreductase [Bacteroidetes bacterium]|nr:nitroreductase [Bacteroidota bacterium]